MEQKTVIYTPSGSYSMYSDGVYRGPSANNNLIGVPMGAIHDVPKTGVLAEANGEFIVSAGFEEAVLREAEKLKIATNTHPVVAAGKKIVILPVATALKKKIQQEK